MYSLHKSQPYGLLSAFTVPKYPGRVYIEARSGNDVSNIISTSRNLSLKHSKLVPQGVITDLLEVSTPRDRTLSGWVRIRGNTPLTAPFVNDLAYLHDLPAHFVLWLVPRHGPCEPGSRPAQSLPNLAYDDVPLPRPPKGVLVDSRGYWGFKARDRRLYRLIPSFPSLAEVNFMEHCLAVPRRLVDSTIDTLRQMSFQRNDRVVVEEQPFQGLSGTIVDIVENRFLVFLPSQDFEEYFYSQQLRKDF